MDNLVTKHDTATRYSLRNSLIDAAITAEFGNDWRLVLGRARNLRVSGSREHKFLSATIKLSAAGFDAVSAALVPG